MGGYTRQCLFSGGRGQPCLDIRQEQLEYLLLTCPRIAILMGVSLSKIRRRMSEYGLALYSTITDQGLNRTDQAYISK